jgi:hypothetical protein
MALSTYTELQADIATWLNRDDLTAQIPSFIRLAESEIDRDSTTLSDTIAELRSIRFVSGSPRRDVVLDIVTPEMLSEIRARFQSSGRPIAAAVIGGKIVVAPSPDQAYSAEAVYFGSLVPLSAENPTNVVLTEAPDLYLYGGLKHSAPFLQHDERLPMWNELFNTALDQLHARREREEHGANFRPMRLPRVFGERP